MKRLLSLMVGLLPIMEVAAGQIVVTILAMTPAVVHHLLERGARNVPV